MSPAATTIGDVLSPLFSAVLCTLVACDPLPHPNSMKAKKHANNAILRRVIFKVNVESIAEADFLERRKREVRSSPGPMGEKFSGNCNVASRNALLQILAS